MVKELLVYGASPMATIMPLVWRAMKEKHGGRGTPIVRIIRTHDAETLRQAGTRRYARWWRRNRRTSRYAPRCGRGSNAARNRRQRVHSLPAGFFMEPEKRYSWVPAAQVVSGTTGSKRWPRP